MIYEIQCLPPNEGYRVVRLEAATIEEALERASRIWMHQTRPPRLLGTISVEPQAYLAGYAS